MAICVWILSREGIEEILPSDAHSLANDSLYVSITHSKSGKNHIMPRFTFREDLTLLASSFVHVYAGLTPVEFRGQKWMDRGFSDSLPVLPLDRIITVSPSSGIQDVCPIHTGYFNTQIRLANMNIMCTGSQSGFNNTEFSVENIRHLNPAMFPPSTNSM
ncbi:hypothetical protein Q8A73_022915 [Channa argus]|nr:hypothetical protein Q8A73_022915 [Channa argus]